jgi:hypothetical protein
MRCQWPRGCTRNTEKQGYCDPHYRKLANAGLLRLNILVDAAPSRAVLNENLRRGRNFENLGKLTGISSRTLKNLRRDDTAYVRLSTAERLARLSLPPTRIGTIRRLHALMRRGFSRTEIALRTGIPRAGISHALYDAPIVAERTTTAVKELFETLSLEEWGPAPRTAAYAAKKNWAPPAAWIGIDIDDPNAQPDYGAEADTELFDEVDVIEIMAGHRRIDYHKCGKRIRAARDEAIYRFGTKHAAAWIGERVGCTARTVERVRARAVVNDEVEIPIVEQQLQKVA